MKFLILLIFALMMSCNSRQPGIKESIGIKPYSDITRRSGIDVTRELIYLNNNHADDFFDTIVFRVENSNTIKNNKFIKTSGRTLEGSTLKENGLDPNDISRSIIFRTPDKGFNCIISDGKKYVIVLIYTT